MGKIISERLAKPGDYENLSHLGSWGTYSPKAVRGSKKHIQNPTDSNSQVTDEKPHKGSSESSEVQGEK